MIRAGHDFEANLSTGRWLVIVDTDCKGMTLEQQSIVISQKESQSKDYLGTCCHEALHASLPNMSEAEVARVEGDLLEILWKRGYRLPKQKKAVEKD